jgi:NAD(P)-dependent dehydrogenase (short-subunit alcohol dehydrogenase family)
LRGYAEAPLGPGAGKAAYSFAAMSTALVIGASSGIGEAVARRLIAAGWTVVGIARRAPAIEAERYHHVVADVRSPDYRGALVGVLDRFGPLEVCLYAAGTGHVLDLAGMAREAEVFATNLVGAVVTAEVVVPRMIARRAGHFVGLSSQADRWIAEDTPSYAASKAGMSSYLEGLALACRPHGVAVTNVRFGFVDTAMSRDQSIRPFLISAERAAVLVERCLVRRPIRFTFPWRMAALLWLVGLGRRLRIWRS